MTKNFVAIPVVIFFAAAIFLLKNISAEEKFSMSVPLTDEQQLKNLYNEMWQALLTKDIKTLDEIHAEDFILTHMTGMNQPKKEYLRCVRDGELNYFSAQVENIFVEVDDTKGKLIGQSKVEAAVFGGRKNTWRLQLAFNVEKRDGKWILTYGKASTY